VTPALRCAGRPLNRPDGSAGQRFEFATPVRAAWRANLLEEPGDRLTARGSAVTISAGPREIVTVRLELAALVSPSASDGAHSRTVRRTQTPP